MDNLPPHILLVRPFSVYDNQPELAGEFQLETYRSLNPKMGILHTRVGKNTHKDSWATQMGVYSTNVQLHVLRWLFFTRLSLGYQNVGISLPHQS